MSSRFALGAGLMLGAALLVPAPVVASEAGRRIEEVIVTAERREASIQDTSISITAFTGQFLDDFGIRNQEDLQNYIPATTIQPYDATVRGVGRNFRALGGDPGVATYMNGVYSEDLLTATAATFWDVERIEVLRGPQGTLYGRNAVGGAINILYKEPTDDFESALRTIFGNFGTQEYYGVVSGPLVDGKLSGRLNFSYRDRDGVIEEIGRGSDDLDSLGSENIAVQFKWTPIDSVEVNVRQNWMDNDRVFGGANGAGLIVLSESGQARRNTTDLVPGYRRIDPAQTNPLARDFQMPNQPVLQFTNPFTGAIDNAQPLRPGMDHYGAAPGIIAAPNLNGFQNAAASLTSFGFTSPQDAERYNRCVFGIGSIDGDEVCAASNGLNWENFKQRGTQLNASWDVNDGLQLKYIYGFNRLSYQRITDDDNTGSLIHDRQFYVNHEADYSSHELQAFYDLSESLSFTSGIFFYDATIDQRGDYYSSVNNARMLNAYQDNTALSEAAATAVLGNAALTGISAGALAFGAGEAARVAAGDFAMVDLYTAKRMCEIAPAPSCQRNWALNNTPNNNLQTSRWYGDNGTNPRLNVKHGPSTLATDLLYATQTQRDAFAAYTQGVWDINETFTLTFGARYAVDEVTAEENLFRYSETGALNTVGNPGFLALYGGLAAVNITNGGLVPDPDSPTGYRATEFATNGGIPFALSVYRPFKRKDNKWTWRTNLDWNINDNAMMYFSATTGYRSGGYSLVYFSNTATYDPEELIAYEIGYKTQWLNNTLQINGAFYLYDYETIHTFSTEVSEIGGTTTSVLEAPGAEVLGVEVEVLWLATDRLTLGSTASYTPSEYTESLLLNDPARISAPASLYPDFEALTEDIKGNQLLQVPEGKFTGWGSYRFDFDGGSNLELFATYSWTDKVYFSPFERKDTMAKAFGRTDLRATWTSPERQWVVSGFVNNVFDELGVLQIIRGGEASFFRQAAMTTTPRLYGLELTYQLGNR